MEAGAAAHAVREARKSKGWTQADLANFMGWSRVKVHRIESGECKSIPLEQVPKLSRLLGVNFSKINGGE